MDQLPLELLPVVLGFVPSPEHISKLCLVNKSFNTFATPLLYRRVFIYAWYKDGKSKVIMLFRSLSTCPHLARHVEKLDQRLSKGALLRKPFRIDTELHAGNGNCVNLQSCTWTRDGSLHSTVLESLCGCSQLQELEINGTDSSYDPAILTRFTRLRKISLIMPNAHVLNILPTWISITGGTLRSLTILCRASTYVTNTFLSDLASNLGRLEFLNIIGCPRVTHEGIAAIASANENGLVGLSIEGLSQAFDMSAFKATCLRTNAFRRLKAITLTICINVPLLEWTRDVGDMLSSAPLEAFSIYLTTTSAWISTPGQFWKRLATDHGRRLKKVSVHRVRIGLDSLEVICSQCPLLEHLFVVVDHHDMDGALRHFALAKNLRTLHVNSPPLTMSELPMASPHILMMQRANSIVSTCSATLGHVGCNTRVWQIEKVVLDGDGEKRVVPRLAPLENPDVPEQFLVVRA